MTNLNAMRLYFVLLGVSIMSLLVLAGAAYGANMLLKEKSKVVHDAQLDVLVLEEQQKRLAKAKADAEKYQELADIAKHIVPQDKDQAQTVREIVKIADEHNVALGSITFPSSTLGDGKSQQTQLTPVKGIEGVMSLEISVRSHNKSPALMTDFLAFLDALEHNRRTALVESIALEPNDDDPRRLDFSLTVREYIKP
jgi:hypothetical protein